ncbi:MAG: signal recognition particle receptor subunit alpha, partial [Actinomycetota bacterium]
MRPTPYDPGAGRAGAPAMLDSLSDRLSETLGDLRSRGRLSEEDVNTAVREIRLALL